MQRVTGIGGIFFKSAQPAALHAWYKQHLGIDVQAWGGAAFAWNANNPDCVGSTLWTVFDAKTDYFGRPDQAFMVNFRVADLDALLAALRAEGCHVLDKLEVSEYGKFGWVVDPDGNRVELWQPPEGQ